MAMREKEMGFILAVGAIMPVSERDAEGHVKIYEVLQVITRRQGERLKWVFRHYAADKKAQDLRGFRCFTIHCVIGLHSATARKHPR